MSRHSRRRPRSQADQGAAALVALRKNWPSPLARPAKRPKFVFPNGATDARTSSLSVSGKSTIPFDIPDFGDASLSSHPYLLPTDGPSSRHSSQVPSLFPLLTETHDDLSLYRGGSLLDISDRHFPASLALAPLPLQNPGETNPNVAADSATYESLLSECIADPLLSDGASLGDAASTSQDGATYVTSYGNATFWNAPNHGPSTSTHEHDVSGSFAPLDSWSTDQGWALNPFAVTEPSWGLTQSPLDLGMAYPSVDSSIPLDLGQTSAPMVPPDSLTSRALPACEPNEAHLTVPPSICASSPQGYVPQPLPSVASYPDLHSAMRRTANPDMQASLGIDPTQEHWTGHWDMNTLDFPHPHPFDPLYSFSIECADEEVQFKVSNPQGHSAKSNGTQQVRDGRAILCNPSSAGSIGSASTMTFPRMTTTLVPRITSVYTASPTRGESDRSKLHCVRVQ